MGSAVTSNRRITSCAALASCSESGGYDYEFVDIIADKYRCNICTKVLKDARLTECCGQHYCDSCLTQWLEKQGGGKTCPHCREEDFKSIKNKEKIREIDEFRVRCIHGRKGCDWMGKLEAIKRHLESCHFVEVKCTNYGYSRPSLQPLLYYESSQKCYCRGTNPVELVSEDGNRKECDAAIERRYLAHHQRNVCKYRQYKCEHCGLTDTYDAIAGTGEILWKKEKPSGRSRGNHYNECGCYPLECPNKCGEKNIKRVQIETHRKTCPLELLDCPFKGVGCDKKMPRKDLAVHTQTRMEAHLLMVVRSHEELARKHEDLVNKNKELTNKIEELKKQGKHK